MPRPYTEARKNNNKKWDDKNIARMSIVVRKEMKPEIQERAAALGLSVNAYIVGLIAEDLTEAGKE